MSKKLSDAQIKMLEDGKAEGGVRLFVFGEETKVKRGDKLVTMGLMTREMIRSNVTSLWVYKTVVEAPVTVETMIESPAEDIPVEELAAPTDATLGDVLYEQDEVNCKWDGQSTLQEGDIVIIPHDDGEDFYGRIVNLEGEKKWFVITDKDGNQDVNESDQYYVRRVYAWADPIPNRWAVKADVPVLPLPYEPAPAPTMRTALIAAKDAYIAQLEATLKSISEAYDACAKLAATPMSHEEYTRLWGIRLEQLFTVCAQSLPQETR